VAEEISRLGSATVLVTGGEPMSQEGTPSLIRELISRKFRVVMETNGTYDLSSLPERVIKVVDVKCPGSGAEGTFLVSNLSVMGPRDWLKFVILNRDDYRWSLDFLRDHGLHGKGVREPDIRVPGILFSPVHDELEPKVLAGWIIEDGVEARLNLQIHKYVGMP
jgi:7-carboxy-7-deazaguanine synthase